MNFVFVYQWNITLKSKFSNKKNRFCVWSYRKYSKVIIDIIIISTDENISKSINQSINRFFEKILEKILFRICVQRISSKPTDTNVIDDRQRHVNDRGRWEIRNILDRESKRNLFHTNVRIERDQPEKIDLKARKTTDNSKQRRAFDVSSRSAGMTRFDASRLTSDHDEDGISVGE